MIKIIDNCISKKAQEEILNLCLYSGIGLSYSKYTTSPYSKKILRGFTHLFFTEHGSVSSSSEVLSYPAKTNLQDKELKRGRLYLQTPTNICVDGEYHVDFNRDHLTMIYYVNDTDGDTLFSNFNDKDFPENMTVKERFEYVNQHISIKERVSPKQGRCVIFDGSIYHASSSPTIDDRFILNYNFAP